MKTKTSIFKVSSITILFFILTMVLCGCSKTTITTTSEPLFNDEYVLVDDNGTIKCENYDYVICLEKDKDKDFKILNFADVQLTSDQVVYENGIATYAYELMRTLIEEVEPDLITLSGDQSYGEPNAINAIASVINKYNIPWAPVFGNHDNDCFEISREAQIDIYASYSNCLIKYGPTQIAFSENSTPRPCNYFINIVERDNSSFHVVRSIFMLNSGDLTEPFDIEGEKLNTHFYENLTDKQIEFYKWGIECSKKYNNGEYVKSTIIQHIPLTAYAFAFAEAFITDYSAYEYNKIHNVAAGYLVRDTYDGSCWKDGYKDSFGVCHEVICSAPLDDGIFEKLIKYGSLDSMIVGHDHKNNFSINYKGVRLSYGVKTGWGSYYESQSIGGTVLTVSGNTITVSHIFK